MGDWRAETPEFQAILHAAYPEKVGSSEAEQARDEAYSSAAWRTMQSRPGLFIRTSGMRLSWFWSPWPHGSLDESKSRSILRVGIGVFYGIEFGLCLIALSRFRNWSSAAQWCFLGWVFWALALSGLHAVYWSNMRMRSPLVPFLAILSVAGASRIVDLWRGQARSTSDS